MFNVRFLSAFVACLTEYELPIIHFETFVNEKLLSIELMRTNHDIPEHSQDRSVLEYASYVGRP